LIDNALRHSAGASRAPIVTLGIEPDGRIALGVRDFGPGVRDEQLQHLAEPFYRPDSARTRASGGVGLGLHLCKLVAQAHRGELRIRRAEPGLDVALLLGPWARRSRAASRPRAVAAVSTARSSVPDRRHRRLAGRCRKLANLCSNASSRARAAARR